ncbi:MAG: choice-of-anchor D domain-containing protein [Nitrospira sp.]|nr:choice-of-anchor D domain-containing protein [Nitrospira sp.]
MKNYVRYVIVGLAVLWAAPAWSASLTWTANTESDLAGYRVYRCTVSNCSRTSGTATLLATLGRVTSFNIGTPSTTLYYFVTAYDYAGNESRESAVVTYTPPSTPPRIGASPISFSFAATQGGPNPASQTLTITNTGGGTLSWTLSESITWLTLSRTSGSGNASVTLSVTTGTLRAGTYSGTIVINATGALPVVIPVTFTVASAPVPVIRVTPTSLTFTAVQGGANPPTQTFTVTNGGGGTLRWSIRNNRGWIVHSPLDGTGNVTVTVGVVTAGLSPGTYTGSISVAAEGASTVWVPVTFTVAAATSSPVVNVSPTSLSFTARVGGSAPPSQALRISNGGGGTLTWRARHNCNGNWFWHSPIDGSGNATITTGVTTAGLLAGTYTCQLSVATPDLSSVVIVPITLTMTP